MHRGERGNYCSEANVKACEQAGITPLLATGRAGHHPTLEERFADPGEAPDTTDPVARMAYRLLVRYAQQVQNGLAACPMRPPDPGCKGRVKQHEATNLLPQLQDYKIQI